VDWRLELVQIPVTDVDRAKTFYTEKWCVQQLPARD